LLQNLFEQLKVHVLLLLLLFYTSVKATVVPKNAQSNQCSIAEEYEWWTRDAVIFNIGLYCRSSCSEFNFGKSLKFRCEPMSFSRALKPRHEILHTRYHFRL